MTFERNAIKEKKIINYEFIKTANVKINATCSNETEN